MADNPRVVKEMPSVELNRAEFERRFRGRHQDPLFDDVDEASRARMMRGAFLELFPHVGEPPAADADR